MFKQGLLKTAAIRLPNWLSNKGAATAAKVQQNVAASQAARKASGFGAGLKSIKGSKETAEAIRSMPNVRAGRTERGIAKSQGEKIKDIGSKYKPSMSKAKAVSAAKAGGTAQPTSQQTASFRDHLNKYKGHYAAGATGFLAAKTLSSDRP